VSEDRFDRDDEELSALLDGALSHEHEAELRGRMQREAGLAERFALLAELQTALQALAAPRAGDAVRVARLREELESRLAAERLRGRAPVPLVPRRRALRWLLPAAAALAAGLLIQLRSPSPPTSGTAAIELTSLSEEEIAIGLDYETLSDLDVIEELDLLELLADLDPVERM
jgi:anti-sigma factor RsiW